jgi:transposase InsO family protein
MHKANLFEGLQVTAEDISSCMKAAKCDACMAGKMTRLPFPLSDGEVEETLHVDVCELEYEGFSGNKYMATCLYEPMDYSFIATIKTKGLAGQFTMDVIELIEKQTSHKVLRLRADNGGEYLSKTLSDYVARKGIHPEWTQPGTPQQNGKAERLNLTLASTARSMLEDSGLPKKLWPETLATANFNRNITMRPSKGIVARNAGEKTRHTHHSVFLAANPT